MSAVFEALPGLPVPVARIQQQLAALRNEGAHAGAGRHDVTASQINLVVHFGFATTPADAVAQFNYVLEFAARYPSRVVFLCPHDPDAPLHEMRAKIHGECFLGRNPDDTRCCEFVILGYPLAARRYLESQVSICLTPDLPLFYWAHAFTDCGRMSDYHYLISKAQRFLVDCAAAPADVLTFPWPRTDHLRDLASARLLPVRQALGQILARHAPALLAQGIAEIKVTHGTGLAAEGAALLRWTAQHLSACGIPSGTPQTLHRHPSADMIQLELLYQNTSRFIWCGHLATGTACLAADYDGTSHRLTTPIHLLTPVAALAEALFF